MGGIEEEPQYCTWKGKQYPISSGACEAIWQSGSFNGRPLCEVPDPYNSGLVFGGECRWTDGYMVVKHNGRVMMVNKISTEKECINPEMRTQGILNITTKECLNGTKIVTYTAVKAPTDWVYPRGVAELTLSGNYPGLPRRNP